MALYKAGKAFMKTVEGRSVTGVFAVHGNVDHGGDRSHPGSFKKTIKEQGQRIKFLWNHDLWGGPPIAKIEGIREVSRDDLPDTVLKFAPDATGGVEVTRRYLRNERAESVFEAVVEGAADEMSYAYDLVKWHVEEDEDTGQEVREIQEVRLYEVSDVIFGMNPATVGSKMWFNLDFLADRVIEGMHTLKAGARNSTADLGRINTIGELAIELGATSVMLVPPPDDSDDEASAGEGKSHAPDASGEPVPTTPLEPAAVEDDPPAKGTDDGAGSRAAEDARERELALTLLAISAHDDVFTEADHEAN